jgi:hypothetical protein
MIPLACPPDAMHPIQLAECDRGKRLLFAARPGTSGHARPSTTADTRPATGLLPGGGGAPARAVGTPPGGPREGSPPVSRLPPAHRAALYYKPVPPPGPPDLSSGPDHRRRAVASQHHRRFARSWRALTTAHGHKPANQARVPLGGLQMPGRLPGSPAAGSTCRAGCLRRPCGPRLGTGLRLSDATRPRSWCTRPLPEPSPTWGSWQRTRRRG